MYTVYNLKKLDCNYNKLLQYAVSISLCMPQTESGERLQRLRCETEATSCCCRARSAALWPRHGEGASLSRAPLPRDGRCWSTQLGARFAAGAAASTHVALCPPLCPVLGMGMAEPRSLPAPVSAGDISCPLPPGALQGLDIALGLCFLPANSSRLFDCCWAQAKFSGGCRSQAGCPRVLLPPGTG